MSRVLIVAVLCSIGTRAQALTFLCSSSAIRDAGGTTITIPVCTDAVGVPNVTLVSWITFKGTAGSLTPLTGWTTIRASVGNGFTHDLSSWFRGTPATSYQWSAAGAALLASGGIMAFTDTATSPVDTWDENIGTSSTAQIATSLNTGTANDILVACWGFGSGSITGFTAGLDVRWNISSDGGVTHYGSACATKQLGAAGATGDQTATNSLSGVYEAQQIAILSSPAVRCLPPDPAPQCTPGWPCRTPTP